MQARDFARSNLLMGLEKAAAKYLHEALLPSELATAIILYLRAFRVLQRQRRWRGGSALSERDSLPLPKCTASIIG
jgi:hypothetical protein